MCLAIAAALASAAAGDVPQHPQPVMRVVRQAGEVRLEGVPPAGGNGNGYVRGLETLLECAGTPVSYERLMGLSGMAFIAQADVDHRWEGKIDVGWWPLDAWGFGLRREFLERALGYRLQLSGWVTLTPEGFLAVRDRLPDVYAEKIGPALRVAIDRGRPGLALTNFGFVATGYDDAQDEPPILGRVAWDTTDAMYRIDEWPPGLIVLGERTAPMDTDAADRATLQCAVDLAQDRAGPREPEWRERRFTGRKAFAGWAAVLREFNEPIEDRHHANMQQNLTWNRTAAVAYLRQVADRHEGEVTAALWEAGTAYESVLEQLAQLKPWGLTEDPDARLRFADQVDAIAATELEAAGHIERALAAWPEPEGQDDVPSRRERAGDG
jgi:hypothetical protein